MGDNRGLDIPSKEELENLYWRERLSVGQIKYKFGKSRRAVLRWMDEYGIPRRSEREAPGQRSLRHRYWVTGPDRIKEHILVAEEILGRPLKAGELAHHRDGNSLNNHPRNLGVLTRSSHAKPGHGSYTLPHGQRPSMFHFYMTMAYTLSYRSTCSRLKVGAIITSFDLEQVYSLGYNGNASGLENSCDSKRPGDCGCIHAEENALVKCGEKDRNKILFVSDSPCLKCAKLIINSGFSWVYYMKPYRSTVPLDLLHYSGVKTCPYPIIIKSIPGADGFSFADPFTGNEVPDLSVVDKMVEDYYGNKKRD